MNGFLRKLLSKAIDAEVEKRARFLLTDADGFYEQQSSPDRRDRQDYDREEVLRLAIDAWRSNPLARRVIMLTSQYVVGGGITLSCRHQATAGFLQAWWEHPLNQLPMRVFEWCEELIRSGELFVLLSTNAAGMSFVRAVPASAVGEVVTAENDLQQELAYVEKDQRPGTQTGVLDGRRWPAYDALIDAPQDGAFPTVMLHFAINRPVGAIRGESDLAPMLKWLARYSAWLEDRARLNRFRQSFLYVVKARFASEAERLARQTALNAAAPSPGSILVTDESEAWSVIHPELDSFEAEKDGLALKKMIATGAGVPLHFLAEPEGTNRTTAESSGGPTFRHFEQRQEYFTLMLREVAKAVVRRRAFVDGHVRPDAEIQVRGTDLSARDNQALAEASRAVIQAFTGLHEKGLIDDAELLRIAYRFAGEAVDVEGMMERIKDKG